MISGLNLCRTDRLVISTVGRDLNSRPVSHTVRFLATLEMTKNCNPTTRLSQDSLIKLENRPLRFRLSQLAHLIDQLIDQRIVKNNIWINFDRQRRFELRHQLGHAQRIEALLGQLHLRIDAFYIGQLEEQLFDELAYPLPRDRIRQGVLFGRGCSFQSACRSRSNLDLRTCSISGYAGRVSTARIDSRRGWFFRRNREKVSVSRTHLMWLVDSAGIGL